MMTWPDSCREWKSRQGWSDVLGIAIVALPPSPPIERMARDDGAQCATQSLAKRARSIALTARGGCYGDNQVHTYTCPPIARNSHPRADITSPVYPPVDSLSHKRRRPRVWPRPFRWMTSAASRMRAQRRTSPRREPPLFTGDTLWCGLCLRTGSRRFVCRYVQILIEYRCF